ncbi:MAG: di-/tripeptide transporter [Helicobacter sp.]|nr:di-/tripeptide transporter [Helicobacter sp.]
MWVFFANRNLRISNITKFALGMIGAGLGFAIMMFAAKVVLNSEGSVSPLWLVGSLFFLTLGELAISPVGLSVMTQIAPHKIKGQVMGLWFVASSLGNVVAGLVGGHVQIDSIQTLPSFFESQMWILFGVAALLLLIKGFIYRILS